MAPRPITRQSDAVVAFRSEHGRRIVVPMPPTGWTDEILTVQHTGRSHPELRMLANILTAHDSWTKATGGGRAGVARGSGAGGSRGGARGARGAHAGAARGAGAGGGRAARGAPAGVAGGAGARAAGGGAGEAAVIYLLELEAKMRRLNEILSSIGRFKIYREQEAKAVVYVAELSFAANPKVTILAKERQTRRKIRKTLREGGINRMDYA